MTPVRMAAIYQNPIAREDFEGNGELVEYIGQVGGVECDAEDVRYELHRYLVRFVPDVDDGATFERTIRFDID
jgi:hypothetical protein